MQAEGKGLKDPEAVKAKQKRREEIERQAEAAGRTGEAPLKVRNTGCWGWGRGAWLGHDIVVIIIVIVKFTAVDCVMMSY